MQILQYVSGLGLMLLACVWGMLSDTTFNKDKKAFIGAHHQWTHAGEMFTAAAFCWQYMRFEKNTTYYIAFVAMWLAMFCNGAAYAIAAYSNDGWIAAPEKEWTFWSNVSFVFVPIITGPACFVAFPMFIYGVWNGRGINQETNSKKA